MRAKGETPRIKRRHRRKVQDQLVRIHGTRVRAAIEWQSLSVNGAAKRLKVSQRTLDSIVRSKTRRCHHSLREKLAALLELPATWLGGESNLLSGLTPWLPYPGVDYPSPVVVDENMMLRRVPAGGTAAQRVGLPPRYQLAAHRLTTQIAEAWRRDIATGDKEAKAALTRLGVGAWKGREWDRAAMLITRLVGAFWWRQLFLKRGPPPESIDDGRDYTDAAWQALVERMARENREKMNEEMQAAEQIAANAATALATALRPWFERRRNLNYPRFMAALEWASSGFGVTPEDLMEENK